MNARLLLLFGYLTLAILGQSCKTETPIYLRPVAKVAKIEDILNGDDQNLIALLNKVRGSVGKRGSGSKTIWSRKNNFGLGLYISANHVYGLGTWSNRDAEFFELNKERRGIFESSQMPQPDGKVSLGNKLIADFPLLHFDIAQSATNSTILPEQDFYIGIVDNQRTVKILLAQYPDILQTTVPLQMFDPRNRTTADQTWNNPVAGQQAIAIGYPQDVTNFPNGAVAHGKILTDIEAVNTIEELKAVGDSEGSVPYNSNAEFFLDAQAIPGMSGGGVFNTEGQLLGIMVRASDHEKAPKIIRVIKISHVRSKLKAFYLTLSNVDKGKLEPFIKDELPQ